MKITFIQEPNKLRYKLSFSQIVTLLDLDPLEIAIYMIHMN